MPAAVKARSKNITFDRFSAAGGWLDMPNRLEIALHHIKQASFGTTAKTFRQKKPIFIQHINGKIQRCLKQSGCSQMVGCTMTCCICGHIAQNAICRSASCKPHFSQHFKIGHIAGKNFGTNNAFGLEQINSDKPRPAMPKLGAN